MSDESKLTPIEMKRENISNSEKKKSDWKKFGKSLLNDFVFTIIIGFIGANLIYVSLLDLDLFFPTDPDKLPYKNPGVGVKSKKGIFSIFKGGAGENVSNQKIPHVQTKNICDNLAQLLDNSSGQKMKGLLNKLGFNEVGFPYSLVKEDGGLLNTFGNSIGTATISSYTFSRGILKRVLTFLNGFGNIGTNILFILGLPILIFLFLWQIPLILGTCITFVSLITEYFKYMPDRYGWIITILITLFLGFIVFGIDLMWATLVGITQTFQFYATLLILPLFDIDNVREIIFCKSHLLLILYVLLTISSAFKYLGDVESVIISLSLIILTYTGLKTTKKI
jgi:hypothetical protein